MSLTCVVGKLFKRLLKKRIVDHIESNNLLSATQHGFRNSLSCTTNLIEFMNFVTPEEDLGNAVDIVYFDFSKAFDKVAHRRLVLKLKAYGIKGKRFMIGANVLC